MQMEAEAAPTGALVQRPTGVPRPRPFPILDNAPGPRCGHTLTTISGPEGDVNRAKLVLFGARLIAWERVAGLVGSQRASPTRFATADHTTTICSPFPACRRSYSAGGLDSQEPRRHTNRITSWTRCRWAGLAWLAAEQRPSWTRLGPNRSLACSCSCYRHPAGRGNQ